MDILFSVLTFVSWLAVGVALGIGVEIWTRRWMRDKHPDSC
jgi:hypothetical protein